MRAIRHRDVYRQCERKQRYRTQGEAQKMARRAFAVRDHRLRAYWCRFCEGWHLTHKLDADGT